LPILTGHQIKAWLLLRAFESEAAEDLANPLNIILTPQDQLGLRRLVRPFVCRATVAT
jgi:hypothetical protein